jgi:regulator of sigma E protease
MNLIITILAFLLTLGILITVHEFGHFYVARKCGVKVLRFCLGFGKPIWRRTGRDGTEYCLALIPLGGYVKMLDEREGDVAPADLDFAFNRKSVWVRIAIVVAGPVANFIFAAIAFCFVYTLGIRDFAPVITEIIPNSVAQYHGLAVGDEIIAVNHIPVEGMQGVRRAFLTQTDPSVYTLAYHRATENVINNVALPKSELPLNTSVLEADFFNKLGFNLGVPAWIGEVEPNSPAASAGLQANDRVIALNAAPINSWSDLVESLSRYPEQTITLTILRNDQTLHIAVKPDAKMQQGQRIGFIGVRINEHLLRMDQVGFGEALWRGTKDTLFYSGLTFKSIWEMLIGRLSVKDISGPISIANYAGDSVQIGLAYFAQFLALLSISLGVINLLPIPMLDGGHLLYYVIEIIRRKPLSLKAQQVGWSIGMMALLLLMTLALYNDIAQIYVKY